MLEGKPQTPERKASGGRQIEKVVGYVDSFIFVMATRV